MGTRKAGSAWLMVAYDRTRYFTTSIPGSGIFLPSSKAYKRASPTVSTDSFPTTPTTPSLATFSLGGRGESNAYTPPTPSTSKFSQSVGPGRAASPAFRKQSRPSLPRPESPLRKGQNISSTPAGRPSIGAPKFSKSQVGTARYAPSPVPGKFGSSLRMGKDTASGDPGKRALNAPRTGMVTPASARPASRSQSRSQSRLGPEAMFDEDPDTTPIGVARTTYGGQGGKPRSRPVSDQDSEMQRLRAQLEDRDKQLKEMSSNLAEMENSVAELQSVMPKQGSNNSVRGSRGPAADDADTTQLRALLREKNDKIAMLTADFDAHRADFRSTIDTLELASTETERVYERRVEDLTQEIRELQERGEDVDSVAQQLKQLEELVQELEEGLEDARRGEAEARGEVEFLRGEVERTRSELRREREKAAAALKGAGAAIENGFNPNVTSRELEQRDDEIRGLKAIIHSLSRDAVSEGTPKSNSRRVSKRRDSAQSQVNGHNNDQLTVERQAREKLEREVKELEGLVDRKTYREEELEHEIERLQNMNAIDKHDSSGSNGFSERTVIPGNRGSGPHGMGISSDLREKTFSLDAHRRAGHFEAVPETDTHSTVTDGSNLWCEICDTGGHDILTCTNMFGNPTNKGGDDDRPKSSPNSQRIGRDVVKEGLKGLAVSSPRADDHVAPLSPSRKSPAVTPKVHQAPMPNPLDQDMVAGKASGVIDGSKWCALCERDGHESVDCPFDDAY